MAGSISGAIGQIPKDWAEALGGQVEPAALSSIDQFVTKRRNLGLTVLPAADRVFASLDATRYADVRAVILGQDPYPNQTHATGLAFSVPRELPPPLPRSLVRIHQALHNDLGVAIPDHGSLAAWAEHGILLLNTVLTVQLESPRSHARARGKC